MKLTKDLLRANKIYNSHGICTQGGGKVFLSYSPSEARACQCAKWTVIGINSNTDPKAHWSDYGRKVFLGKMRSPAFEEAKQWASQRYGIQEWVRDPFGDWQDAEVMKRLQQLLQNIPEKVSQKPLTAVSR